MLVSNCGDFLNPRAPCWQYWELSDVFGPEAVPLSRLLAIYETTAYLIPRILRSWVRLICLQLSLCAVHGDPGRLSKPLLSLWRRLSHHILSPPVPVVYILWRESDSAYPCWVIVAAAQQILAELMEGDHRSSSSANPGWVGGRRHGLAVSEVSCGSQAHSVASAELSGCPGPPPILSGNLQSLLPYVPPFLFPLRFQFQWRLMVARLCLSPHRWANYHHTGELVISPQVSQLKAEKWANYLPTGDWGVQIIRPQGSQLSACRGANYHPTGESIITPQVSQLTAHRWANYQPAGQPIISPQVSQLTAHRSDNYQPTGEPNISPQVSQLLAHKSADYQPTGQPTNSPQVGKLSAHSWGEIMCTQVNIHQHTVGQIIMRYCTLFLK